MIKTDTINTKEFFENVSKKRVLSEERELLLSKVVKEISRLYKKDNHINVNFICTHNSRRSQLGQVWSYFAADYFQLNVDAFSGGTEVTAFHRNTVKTLKEVGFLFSVQEFSHVNPVYEIKFKNSKKTLLGFSKIFDHEINASPYVVITTCNSADENCPFIPDAEARFHLPFVDPKYSDGTDEQSDVYMNTNIEVASEVYYIFSKLKESLN